MNICVFCGSASGNNPLYLETATMVGQTFAARGIGLVYGGGRVGLMGAVADAVMAGGGTVVGVMPKALVAREVEHRGLTEFHTVETMHERKMLMADRADAFLALPGGPGTLEEIFEQWTWGQLGIHKKPSGFLNVNGYYDPLRAMIVQITNEGFMKPEYEKMIAFSNSLDALLEAFANYVPPPQKWLKPGNVPPA